MNSAIQNILIAGGSGLIGQRLSELLEGRNFRVSFLTRHPASTGGNQFHWDPERKIIDPQAIENADVIINLAGAGLADHRWTTRYKRKIVNSRIMSTNLLYESLKSRPNRVKLLINASAVGIYGNPGERIMHEDAQPSGDFLGQTCRRWEEATLPFAASGIRTVILRLGVVLSLDGGMLHEILKPLRFGIAPVFGNGRQYVSWIHIDDVCKLMVKAITNEAMSGVYNAVAPVPLTNRNFMKLLGQIRGKRFALVPVPGLLMKILLGEKSVILLNGARVSSEKSEDSGFEFTYPNPNQAIRNLLGK